MGVIDLILRMTFFIVVFTFIISIPVTLWYCLVFVLLKSLRKR